MRAKYIEYPVWLFYWWWGKGNTSPDMKKFRKTIVKDELLAIKNGRSISSEPIIEAGNVIDKYKTWR